MYVRMGERGSVHLVYKHTLVRSKRGVGSLEREVQSVRSIQSMHALMLCSCPKHASDACRLGKTLRPVQCASRVWWYGHTWQSLEQ
jgi:hypothetical protein